MKCLKSLILISMVFLLASIALWAAAIPDKIEYQGKLTNDNGIALNGTFDIVFRIFDVPTGGVALWTENHTGANAVTITNGLFDVMLGSLTSLSGLDFSVAYYLEIQVGTAIMTPREEFVPVPYAMRVLNNNVSQLSDLTDVNTSTPTNGNILMANGTDWNSVAQTNITQLGVITAGTWNGTAIGATYGGTGQSAVSTGDVLYGSAANTWSRLGVGSAGQVLTVSGGVPSWQDAPGGSPGGANGAVQFNDAGAFGGDENNFFWDNTNKRLGIGTSSPNADFAIEASYNVATPTISYANYINIANTNLNAGDVYGEYINSATSQSNNTNSVFGIYAKATSNNSVEYGYGGYFTVAGGYDAAGYGVYGLGGDYGVYGNGLIGVLGYSNNATGTGVYAEQLNASGWALYSNGSKNHFTGSVGIGVLNPSYPLDVSGKARISGNILASGNYLNFNGTDGSTGYGFRYDTGTSKIQYRHNTSDSWLAIPDPPSTPGGTVEYWYRPDPPNNIYIQPVSNDNIHIYDSGESYGFYYDGNTNQYGGYFVTSSATTPTSAVVGFSDVASQQTYGYLGYKGDYTFAGQTIHGSAVYGLVDDADRVSGFFRTTSNASFAANVNYSNVWIAGYNYVENSSNTYNPSALYGELDLTGSTLTGSHIAVEGYSNRGTTTGNPGYTIGVLGVANSQNEDAYGVEGVAYSDATVRAGGYFEALNYAASISAAYAYVATDVGGTSRKITGTASVSEIIPTKTHGRIMLTCPESPEYWYIDYGSVMLKNGKAHVELDPILVDISVIDAENPIKVFPQVNIPHCNGVAVINKSSTGFDLVELNDGTSSGEVDYQIVVKPKTNYGEGRFPQGPGPAWLKADKEPQAAKAANQIKGKVFKWSPDWEVYGYNPADYGIPLKPMDVKKTESSENR